MLNFFDRLSLYFRRRWLYGLLSLFTAVSLVIATPHTSQAVPLLDLLLRGVQVLQLSTLSDQQEVSLGRQINQQLVSEEIKIYNNPTITQYVNQIGQRLAPFSDRPNIPYTFQVVEGDQINAFATMGGFVYVTTGLLKAADNEAQLASVIAHEIGHIAGRHAVENLREGALASGLVSAAGLDRNAAVRLGVEFAVRRPNSRQDELEADQKGLANLRRTRYAPGAMVDFMEKLANQRSIPSFLSTHPAVRDRIVALDRTIDPATANMGDGLDSATYRSKIASVR
ncbi:M48 family metallopeptidase [Leptolyngbya sp. FACHB-711]|jgi:predicted Zn-dependent protease|uniref:M48 family metallopeptidase n=1 Tax=unclassified Leptolyngbya TaxID=2650499 RepID=UPI0016829FA4|nr:M48 family metallopeptidase [Leptolyngbya sp. FACHB-711]MBD1852825.1 M48 family metalloprotease [Cyanobacteria bacterium FACHB-502]MBD2023239.1 M48 family metalloprotease [Leptolyngbya sp. FACHB-711]